MKEKNRKIIDILVEIGKKQCKVLDTKIQDADRKCKERQQAQFNAAMAQQALELKANLTPDIREILSGNLYLSQAEPPVIIECKFNPKENLWYLAVETLIKTDRDLERPRVVSSLNDTRAVYFRQLYIKMQEDQIDLAIYENSPTAEQITADLKRHQISERYRLLSHSLVFTSIRCKPEGNYTSVKIYACFR